MNLFRWITRIAGIAALVIGLALSLFPAIRLHMALGGIVAAMLAILSVMALSTRVRVPAAVAGLVWAAVLVYVGTRQTQWLTGGSHWIIEVIHALIGIGAVGFAEMLAGAIVRKRSSLG